MWKDLSDFWLRRSERHRESAAQRCCKESHALSTDEDSEPPLIKDVVSDRTLSTFQLEPQERNLRSRS